MDEWASLLDSVVLPVRSLTLAAVIQHDLARLPPDVLPHDSERHIGRQDRVVTRDLPHIVRPHVDGLLGGVLFVRGSGQMGRAVGLLGHLGRWLVVGIHGWAGRCVRCSPAWSTKPHVF